MRVLDEILNSLADGKWHLLTEIGVKLGVEKTKMTLAVAFLKTYDFIEVFGNKIKIKPTVHEFIRRIRWIERIQSYG